MYKKQIAAMRMGFVLLAMVGIPLMCSAQAPVFTIAPQHSTINFKVKSSVLIAGKFDKWDATLVFTSPSVSTGVLNITIQAGSVDTGSGMKNNKLKGKDFFYVDKNPTIAFRSSKMIQTGPDTFDVPGTFSIRGVSNLETLKLKISNMATDTGTIHAAMAFNRRGYEIHGSIPFIKIADLVEVDIHLNVQRVSGPPLL